MSTGPSPTPLHPRLVLASASPTRAGLLHAAGIAVEVQPARIDETAVRAALAAEDATPRDIADTLAEMKARRVADRTPGAVVLGCDQVLAFRGQAWGKPADRAAAAEQLRALSGQTHLLLSAVVLFRDGVPEWRHVGEARLTMRPLADAFIEAYLDRTWPGIADSVGGYRIEEEGIRLFERIEGDHFTILGLPLLPLLLYLGQRGFIPA